LLSGFGNSCAEAEELRREYAQSWRDSDVELGIKKPKRPMVSASAAAAASDLEKTSGSEGACSLKGFDEGLFRIFLCVKHCKCRSVLSLSSFSVFDCNQLMNLLVTWLSCLLVTWLSCPGLEVFGHIIHAYISEYF